MEIRFSGGFVEIKEIAKPAYPGVVGLVTPATQRARPRWQGCEPRVIEGGRKSPLRGRRKFQHLRSI